MIQAVAIGIGFLGSGVIFVDKNHERLLGLTTAASIWATAAIGIAAGLRHYVLADGATLLLILVLQGDEAVRVGSDEKAESARATGRI